MWFRARDRWPETTARSADLFWTASLQLLAERFAEFLPFHKLALHAFHAGRRTLYGKIDKLGIMGWRIGHIKKPGRQKLPPLRLGILPLNLHAENHIIIKRAYLV